MRATQTRPNALAAARKAGSLRTPQRPKVLLIHAEDEARLRCCNSLREHGFEPVPTADPEVALRFVATQQFVAIVVDLECPRHDVLDVVTCLRNHPPTSEVPIVALSAVLTEDVRELVTSRGCNEVLARPAPTHLIGEALSRAAVAVA